MDEHGDFPASHVSELRGVNASFQNAFSVVDLVSRLSKPVTALNLDDGRPECSTTGSNATSITGVVFFRK